MLVMSLIVLAMGGKSVIEKGYSLTIVVVLVVLVIQTEADEVLSQDN